MYTNEGYLVIFVAVQAHSYPSATGVTVNSRIGSGRGDAQELLFLHHQGQCLGEQHPMVKASYTTDVL